MLFPEVRRALLVLLLDVELPGDPSYSLVVAFNVRR